MFHRWHVRSRPYNIIWVGFVWSAWWSVHASPGGICKIRKICTCVPGGICMICMICAHVFAGWDPFYLHVLHMVSPGGICVICDSWSVHMFATWDLYDLHVLHMFFTGWDLYDLYVLHMFHPVVFVWSVCMTCMCCTCFTRWDLCDLYDVQLFHRAGSVWSTVDLTHDISISAKKDVNDLLYSCRSWSALALD